MMNRDQENLRRLNQLMSMRRVCGRYIGPRPSLTDETALIRYEDNGTLLAQFDNHWALDHYYTHGWRPFPGEDFEIIS